MEWDLGVTAVTSCRNTVSLMFLSEWTLIPRLKFIWLWLKRRKKVKGKKSFHDDSGTVPIRRMWCIVLSDRALNRNWSLHSLNQFQTSPFVPFFIFFVLPFCVHFHPYSVPPGAFRPWFPVLFEMNPGILYFSVYLTWFSGVCDVHVSMIPKPRIIRIWFINIRVNSLSPVWFICTLFESLSRELFIRNVHIIIVYFL